MSITTNLKSGEVNFFYDSGDGLKKRGTLCTEEYLKGGDICSNDIPFCVGATAGGGVGEIKPDYSKFDLYACRLYTRILDDVEIEKNYHESIDYHKYLENS